MLTRVSNIAPSYKSGYAKSASESCVPAFWYGLENCIAPVLGITGPSGDNSCTFPDISGKGKDGTFVLGSTSGGPTYEWQQTEKGQSWYFGPAGSVNDSRIETDTAGLDGFPAITTFAWFKDIGASIDTWWSLVDKYWDGTDRSYMLRVTVSTGNANFLCSTDSQNDNDQASGTTDVTTGIHLVVGTWSAVDNLIRIYVDGVQEGTQSQAGSTVRSSSSPVWYGGSYYNNGPRGEFNGNLLLGGVSSRAWTPKEIADFSADPLAPFRQRLIIPHTDLEPKIPTGKALIRNRLGAQNTNEIDSSKNFNWGLSSWWSFKQKGGNAVRDIVGSSNGTFEASMSGDDWVASPFTGIKAIDFDGSDDYIDSNLSIKGYSELTVSTWFYFNATGTSENFVSAWDTGARFLIMRKTTSETLQGFLYTTFQVGGVFLFPSTPLLAKTWYHMTLTYNGAKVYAYLNGIRSTTNYSISGNVGNSETDRNLYFGGGPGTVSENQLAGKITNVRVYNRALSILEVKGLYNASRTGTEYKGPYIPISSDTDSIKPVSRQQQQFTG